MKTYTLYKPRKEKNGIAVSFDFSDNGCFLKLAKQKPSTGEHDSFDWNDEKGKAKNVISLGMPDITAFLSLFNKNVSEVKLYHEFEKGDKKIVTQITISPYATGGVPRGYSVNIIRDGEKFGFGISFAEAEALKVLFGYAILTLTEFRRKA